MCRAGSWLASICGDGFGWGRSLWPLGLGGGYPPGQVAFVLAHYTDAIRRFAPSDSSKTLHFLSLHYEYLELTSGHSVWRDLGFRGGQLGLAPWSADSRIDGSHWPRGNAPFGTNSPGRNDDVDLQATYAHDCFLLDAGRPIVSCLRFDGRCSGSKQAASGSQDRGPCCGKRISSVIAIH